MKTRTIILFPCIALMCVACVKDPGQTPGAKEPVNVAAIESLSDYAVPVQSNMATVVTYGTDTLAITRYATTISVPRAAKEAGEIKVSYSDKDIYENFSSSSYWQYLSFEDTRNGDYDYNDLVIHGRIQNIGKWLGNDSQGNAMWEYKHVVAIQPVALGSDPSTKIKVGILYKADPNSSELSEKILTEDVRATLFNGNPLFPINTDPAKERKKVTSKLSTVFEFTDRNIKFPVVWFIETPSAGRLYAATTNFDANKSYDMISPDGYPYGISLTEKWNYPVERCHIWDAYPGFYEWIKTGNEKQLLMNQNKKNVFPAAIPKSEGESLWDWEE